MYLECVSSLWGLQATYTLALRTFEKEGSQTYHVLILIGSCMITLSVLETNAVNRIVRMHFGKLLCERWMVVLIEM